MQPPEITLAVAVCLVTATSIGAEVPPACKHVDSQGAIHFSNLPLRADSQLVTCIGAEPTLKQLAADRSWHTAQSMVKIGMTKREVLAIPGLSLRLRDRNAFETASGTDEWRYYADGFAIHLHNDRVATIVRK